MNLYNDSLRMEMQYTDKKEAIPVKKRMLSLFLSLCMALALFPAPVTHAEGEPALVWYNVHTEWVDGTPQYTVDDSFDPNDWDLTGPQGETWVVQFLYSNGGRVTPLTFDELNISATGITLSPVEGGQYVLVEFEAFGGTGTVSYAGASLSLFCQLATFGFYSTQEATEETYLSMWRYTGTNDTIYLILRDGATVNDAWEGNSHNGAETALVSDTCISVRVTDPQEGWLDICIDGQWGNGEPFFEPMHYGIAIDDLRPQLVWYWVDQEWDNAQQTDIYRVRDWEEPCWGEMSASPGGARLVQFFLRENGELTLLTYNDVEADGDCIHLESVADDAYVRIVFDDFGEARVFLTYQEREIGVNVLSELPTFGIYRTQEPSKVSFLKEWRFDGTMTTVYFIARNGATIADLRERNSDNGAAARRVSDTCWTITMEDPTSDWLDLAYSGTRENGDRFEEDGYDIAIDDLRAKIVWYWADWDWDEYGEATYFVREDQELEEYGRLQNNPGSDNIVQFLLKNGNYLIPLEFADLTAEGECFHLESLQDGAFVRIVYDDWGEGRITAERDGLTASRRVYCRLGGWNFSSTPEASEETYLSTWVFDGSNTTVYLVSADGIRFRDAEENTDNGADVSVILDGAAVQITLREPVSNWLSIGFTADFGDHEEWQSYGIQIDDVRPQLVWYWVEAQWDSEQEKDVYVVRDDWSYDFGQMVGTPGEDRLVQFLMKDGETLTPLTFDDLQVSGTAVHLEPEEDGAYVRIVFDGFADSNECKIYYTYEGRDCPVWILSLLPAIGFYTSPEGGQENYLPVWRFDGSNTTVYLLIEGDATLDNVCESPYDEQHGATFKQISDSCWSVTLTDPIRDWLDLWCYGTWTEDETFEEYSCDIRIEDVRPKLVWYWADWDRNVDGVDYFIVHEDQELNENGRFQNTPGRDSTVQFLLKNGEDLIPLTYDELTAEGDCFHLEPLQGGTYVRVVFDDWGEGRITTEKDGVTASRRIYCRLGGWGFFSAPEANEENYISKWIYTGENKTIYFAALDSILLRDVEIDSANDVTFELSDDETCLALTIEELQDTFLAVRFNAVFPDGRVEYDLWEEIWIEDRTPGLRLRWPDYDEGGNVTLRDEYLSNCQIPYMEQRTVEVLFFDGEGYTSLPADALTIDKHLLLMEADNFAPEGIHLIRLMAMHAGDTFLTYTKDGVAYRLPVNNFLPESFFKEQNREEGNLLLNGVDYYLLSGEGESRYAWVLTPFGLDKSFAEQFYAIRREESGDTRLECVPVLRPGTEKDYDLRITVTEPGEDGYDLVVQNDRGLVFGSDYVYNYEYVYDGSRLHFHMEQEILPDGTIVTETFPDMYSRYGYTVGGVIHFRVRLDSDKPWITSGLTLDDPTVGSLTWLDEQGVWEFSARKCGSVTFLYTDPADGRLYGHKAALVLGSGFYSEPHMSEENVLLFPYTVRYTPGTEASFYYLGSMVESVVCEESFITVEQIDDEAWKLMVSDTAAGYLSAQVTVTWVDGWTEHYTVYFDDGAGAVEIGDTPEVEINATTGEVSVTATLENRTDRTLEGDVVAAVYENGRFLTMVRLRGVILTAGQSMEQELELNIRSLYSDRENLTVKLYFLSEDGMIPLAEAVSVPVS